MDQTTTTAVESPAEKKAIAARLFAFLAAMALAILAFVRRLFGLATSTASELKGDAVAAVDTARRGVEATGRVVGRGLAGPAMILDATASAVGATLGAILPRAPVTAADVARGAVARDDRHETTAGYAPVDAVEVPAPAPSLTTPLLVRAHADAALDGTGHRTRGLPPIDAELATWIRTLPKGQLLKVAVATPEAIARHLTAPNDDERIPGVLPVPTPAALRAAKTRVDAAMAILKSLPTRPDLSATDAFRALGVNDDQPEDENEPVARFGR